jgi:hypothetical protein
MLKRVLVLTVALLFGLHAGIALAAATGNPDTGPGCGLGKIAWQNYPHQKTIGVQVLEVTTNGTGMNTFGISSGTSGCTNDGQVWASEKANVFAAINFENLAQDMARGHGEHLTSLATLMDIPADQQPTFFAMTQERYTYFVKAGESSPGAMIKALNDAAGTHPTLGKVSLKK